MVEVGSRPLGKDELLLIGEDADQVIVVSRLLASLMRLAVMVAAERGDALASRISDLSEFQSLCSELDGES